MSARRMDYTCTMKPTIGTILHLFLLLSLLGSQAMAGSPFLSREEANTVLGSRDLRGSLALATQLGSRSEIEDGWEDMYDYKKYASLPPEAKAIQQLEHAMDNGWLLGKEQRERLVTQIMVGSGIGIAQVSAQFSTHVQQIASSRRLGMKTTSSPVR